MIMRNQPPNFRWWVGGVALLAGVAFGWRFVSSGDRPSLIFALISLTLAGYRLIFDREPAVDQEPAFDREPEPPDRQST